MHKLWAILRLARFDASLLGFLALFIPHYARTRDAALSLSRSFPLLLIYVCAFIANDLDDRDRDAVNHPTRPLPAGDLGTTSAAILFFCCLGGTLFLIRHSIDERAAFWYYALVALAISYHYIVEYLPSIKAPYVATTISVPLFLVAASYPTEPKLNILATVGLLFALGRELCMDVADRAGDVESQLHRIDPGLLARIAFGLHLTGVLILYTQTQGLVDEVVLVAVVIILLLSGVYWFKFKRARVSYTLMKLQLLVALYFLSR